MQGLQGKETYRKRVHAGDENVRLLNNADSDLKSDSQFDSSLDSSVNALSIYCSYFSHSGQVGKKLITLKRVWLVLKIITKCKVHRT